MLMYAMPPEHPRKSNATPCVSRSGDQFIGSVHVK
jgi:hypothetical protein